MREIREANSALQTEIASLQHAAVAKASFAHAQAATIATVRADLSEAIERHKEVDAGHHARIKDLHKKLKEEAAGRAASDALLVRHRTSAAEVAPHMANAAAALTALRQARKQLEAGLTSEKEAAQELQKRGSALATRLKAEEVLRQQIEAERAAALAVIMPIIGGSPQDDGSTDQPMQLLVGAVKDLASRLNIALAAVTETRKSAEDAATSAEDARRKECREHKVEVEELRKELAELRDDKAAALHANARDQKNIHAQRQRIKEAEQRADERDAAVHRLTTQLENLTSDAQEQATSTHGLEAALKRAEALVAASAFDSEKGYQAAAEAREAASNAERQRNDAIAAAKQSERSQEAATKRLVAAEEATTAAQAEVDTLRGQVYDLRSKVTASERALQQSVTKCQGLEETLSKTSNDAAEARRVGAEKTKKLSRELETAQSQVTDLRRRLSEVSDSKRAADAAAHKAGEHAKELREQIKGSSVEAATARTAAEKLRQELSEAKESHEKELGQKARMLSEILEAMQLEESAKSAAFADVRSLHQALDRAQEALHEAEEGRRVAEDAATSQTAALAATKRRADTYRDENRALLSNYDEWLRTLVTANRGNATAAAQVKLPSPCAA